MDDAHRSPQPGESRRGWADLCPMPGFGGEAPVDRRNPWLVAWHVLFYGSLAVGLGQTLADAPSPAQARIASALSLALAVWYGWWMVVRQDRMMVEPIARGLYLVVAGVLWVVLLAIDRAFGIMAFTAFAQVFGYVDWPASLAAAAIVSLLLLGAGGWEGALAGAGGLRWEGIEAGDVVEQLVSLAIITFLVLSMRAVVRQSAARQRLIDQLREMREELAVAEREAGTLSERQRLAAEIHDTVAQDLASAVMLLEAAQASTTLDSKTAADHMSRALDGVRGSLREVRRMVWSLRPEELERSTLVQAVNCLVTEVEEKMDTAARTVVSGRPESLPTEVEVTLFRATQEALANVRRHAHAHQVTVTLSYLEDAVLLDVQDDGVGFDLNAKSDPGVEGGMGLPGLRDRAERVNGSLTVESALGEGTTVAVAVPLDSGSLDEPALQRGER